MYYYFIFHFCIKFSKFWVTQPVIMISNGQLEKSKIAKQLKYYSGPQSLIAQAFTISTDEILIIVVVAADLIWVRFLKQLLVRRQVCNTEYGAYHQYIEWENRRKLENLLWRRKY